jgi:hypothetical protein
MKEATMDADIKNLQDALEWLDRSIREEAELDGEMSNTHAIQLGFIQNMLAKFPRRNCDVGTAEEQQARHCAWCRKHGINGDNKVNCAHPDTSCDLCALRWAQMPYEEGGAK